jgi:hypothetical protein
MPTAADYLSVGTAEQRYYNSTSPPANYYHNHYQSTQRNGSWSCFSMSAGSWGSGGIVYSPLPVEEVILFIDVLGVQQRRCGGGETSKVIK